MIFDDEDEQSGGEGGGMLRWLITYADLITLLLAFFIILYAMNRTQQVKFSLVAQALANKFDSASAIGSAPGPSIISGASGIQAQHRELVRLDHLASRLQTAVQKVGVAKQVSVTENQRGVLVSLNATVLFRPGSATLTPRSVAILDRVGQALASVPNQVEVAGYTDSTPIRTVQFPSNWQLSAMRSANVVYVLSRVPHLNPSRLAVMGFGRYHPRATNATSAGRQKNRRVDILVLRSNVAAVAIGNGP